MKRRWVRLEGKTNKGKMLVKLHGSDWLVTEERAGVPCLGGESGLFIQPNKLGRVVGERWVALKNDKNFEIILDEIVEFM